MVFIFLLSFAICIFFLEHRNIKMFYILIHNENDAKLCCLLPTQDFFGRQFFQDKILDFQTLLNMSISLRDVVSVGCRK